MRRILLFFVAVVSTFFFTTVFVGTVYAHCRTDNLGDIFSLIERRARLMKDVAAIKWLKSADASPYSGAQEMKVLDFAGKMAEKYNFNKESVYIFMQIQMDVAKHIQSFWMQKWNDKAVQQPTLSTMPSLRVLRLKISSVNDKLFLQMGAYIQDVEHCSSEAIAAGIYPYLQDVEGIPKKPDFVRIIAHSLQQIHEGK